MLTRNQESFERVSQSLHVVEDLMNMRNKVLSLYNALATRRADGDSMQALLDEFCEVLVDYAAATHFRLYRLLEEKKIERRKAVLELARSVYPRIVETTQSIIDFNDRYENGNVVADAKRFEEALSRLGEELADRIELEDQLMDKLAAPRRTLNS